MFVSLVAGWNSMEPAGGPAYQCLTFVVQTWKKLKDKINWPHLYGSFRFCNFLIYQNNLERALSLAQFVLECWAQGEPRLSALQHGCRPDLLMGRHKPFNIELLEFYVSVGSPQFSARKFDALNCRREFLFIWQRVNIFARLTGPLGFSLVCRHDLYAHSLSWSWKKREKSRTRTDIFFSSDFCTFLLVLRRSTFLSFYVDEILNARSLTFKTMRLWLSFSWHVMCSSLWRSLVDAPLF